MHPFVIDLKFSDNNSSTSAKAMDVDERSRLLPDQEPRDAPTPAPSAFPRRHLIYCLLIFTISFLVVSSTFFQAVPLFELLTRNICHRLHPEYEPGSPECFVDGEVGAELVLVTRWSYVFTILPGILTAIPYGFLTDQYGRKFGLFLSIVGLVLAQAFNIIVHLWPNVFHHRLTWISSLFMFIGGGSVVLSSILFSMLSDIAPDVHRTTTFFGIGVSWLAAELLVFPLASTLTHKSVWLPVFIGISFYIPTIAIALFLPETLHMKAPDLAEAALANEEARDEDVEHHDGPWWSQLRHSFTEGLPRLREATLSIFWGNRPVALLLLTLFVTSAGRSAEIMLFQFVNWRFNWDWLKVGYLVSSKAACSAIVLLLVLPAANYLTIRREMMAKRRDLLFARISGMLLIVGNLVVGLAPISSLMLVGLVILCFGYPYGFILRGLLSELVDGHHRGLLFASVALVENLGSVLGRPLMGVCFGGGVNFGGVWTGLPFLVAAVFVVLAVMILRFVRV
ncbi:major facilitator superfamily domain-containing protein [Trichoderma austrokoningii]